MKERAERILKDLENRNTTGLAAMDQLAALAAEKEAAIKAAKDSGLSPQAFGVYLGTQGRQAAFRKRRDHPLELAKEAETLLARFPNATVNADEQRRLRAALYRPLINSAERRSAADVSILSSPYLADGETDAGA